MVVAAFACVLARPQTGDNRHHLARSGGHHEDKETDTREKRQAEEGAEGDAGPHLFHGAHLWNLDDYHQEGERKKRETEQENDAWNPMDNKDSKVNM